MNNDSSGVGAKFTPNEAIMVAALLILIGVFTIFDVLEDWRDGAPLSHILPEVTVIAAAAASALYMLNRLAASRRDTIVSARQELAAARNKAFEWESKAKDLRSGITQTISDQLQEWGLTCAEKDVCFLLLKGLSLAEISQARSASERTIRNQTSAIYSKSGLSGRAQLSAYFLEDLFG